MAGIIYLSKAVLVSLSQTEISWKSNRDDMRNEVSLHTYSSLQLGMARHDLLMQLCHTACCNFRNV